LNKRIHSRIGLIFSILSGLLSLVFSCAIYFSVLHLGQHIIDDRLVSESEEISRYLANGAAFNPIDTAEIKTYRLASSTNNPNIPVNVRQLLPGLHDVVLGGARYRVLVADLKDARFFILVTAAKQHAMDNWIFELLVGFCLSMIILMVMTSYWLARQAVVPLTRLTSIISKIELDDANFLVQKLVRNDEVGELARAFDFYAHRVRVLIKREQDFTSDISHEFRTSLAVLLSTAEVLRQSSNLTPTQTNRIHWIEQAALDMSRLSSAVLLLAREPAAHGSYQCAVADVVRETIDKHQKEADDRAQILELQLIEAPILNINPLLMSTAVDNLLRNALFHTPNGIVTVRLERDRLIVKDNGEGIPEDILPHILERHVKGGASTGEGVGLSLVHRICISQGWQITIDSLPQKGTAVQIVFSKQRISE
jgi:signal transduction histidine kinase